MLIPMSIGLVSDLGIPPGAWDISTAVYNQSLSLVSTPVNPSGVSFSPDGTRLYISGFNSFVSGNDIDQYDLSTAWDVSTASFVRTLALPATFTFDNRFKPDGTVLFTIDSGSDRVRSYTLSTAWDISTTSASSTLFVGGQDANPQGFDIGDAGSKLYFTGVSNHRVYEYDLSTPYDLSTAAFNQSLSIVSNVSSATGIFFRPNGLSMFVADGSANNVNEYTLTTPWDISTASYTQNFSVSANVSTLFGLFFGDDGTKMYGVDRAGSAEELVEYDLGT